MNKQIRTVCWLLSLMLAASALSCRHREPEVNVPAPTTAAASEATPVPTEMTSPVPTGTPTPVPTGIPTPETLEPDVFTAPEEGCAIEFPDRPLYHYQMDLTLNEADRTVSGHVVFDFYNDSEDPWDKLCMRDYPSLFTDPEPVGYDSSLALNGALTEIGAVTDGRDGSVPAYERDDDVSVLWLGLRKPLAPNDRMTLEYDFTATVPTVADRFGVEAGVFNVTCFYPILAEYENGDWSHAAYYDMGECFYSEVSDYDVKLTVPAGFTVAATGTETGKSETDGAVTYTYHAPCVRDFVFSASRTFVRESAVFDGVRVNVLYNPESVPTPDMTAPVSETFRAAEDTLAALDKAFGRYPYEELDIVLAPICAGGMEYPNLVIISDWLCDPDYSGYETDDKRYEPLKNCVAHEIAHQWFMGIVGSNSGMQPWQDESFASYSVLVYAEYIGELDGDRMADVTEWNLSDPGKLQQLKNSLCCPINRAYYDFRMPLFYQQAVYSLGQAVLFRMEEILGEKEFHAVVREYVRRNAFSNADPQSFFDVLFEYAGTDNAALNELVGAVFDL